ncbi:MAG: transcriptional regulator [Ignavibacteria bacterium RBG_13_36_8]|nr:MAG: transcriptional regulator [Ignavibacteria bacterium RBG_13_36_8]
MDQKELLKLIESGEGLRIEFKQRFSSYEKIAKELIALANTCGGFLLIGIDDDKSIYGVDSEKSVTELLKETAEKYCEPPIHYGVEYIEIEGKEIVVVNVHESNNKPHRIQDYLKKINPNTANVFVRVNDKSVLASKEMIKVLQARNDELSLKKYIVGRDEKFVFDYLDKNETITVKDLSKHANMSGRRASRTLIKLVRANMLIIHNRDNGEDYYTYTGR